MARKGEEPHPRDLGLSQPKCENTLHNRRVVQAIMGDNRPVWAPEIFIMPGAQAALGVGPRPGPHRVDSVMTSGLHDKAFRARLSHLEQAKSPGNPPAKQPEYEPGE